MEPPSEQASTPTQSCNSRTEKGHPPEVDYYAELSTWVQRAIQETEKNKDFNKKDQFLILLKNL